VDTQEALVSAAEAWAPMEVHMLVGLLAALHLARTVQPAVLLVQAEARDPWPMSGVVKVGI